MATLVCNGEIIQTSADTFVCNNVALLSEELIIDPVVATTVFGAGFSLFAIPFLIGWSVMIVVNMVRGIR